MHDGSIYRIVDASLNRANEGFRTIEDHARFVLNHHELTTRVKHLRHELAAAAAVLDRNQLISNRDTVNDCGTGIKTDAEQSRQSVEQVLAAAFSRVQQALRSIEEYGKLISGPMAAHVEHIRYKMYTLEKDWMLFMESSSHLSDARLYLLVDIAGETDDWLNRLRALAIGGADVIQIRDKRADDRTLYQRCKLAAEMFRELELRDPSTSDRRRCQLIINDRADIAAAVDADGVHVGQEELPVAVVRKIIGDGKLIGLSTHSVEQVRQAVDCEADYIGCGPTFPSRTKSFDQYVGVALAASACRDFTIPAFAIGGIDEGNVHELMAVGVNRIAVSGAIWGQPDEVERCQRFADRLRN